MNKGKIHQIVGPVIDVKFSEDNMPELLNAIHIEYEGRTIVAEVAQHIGDDVARCIALSSTDGLSRGMEVIDTGEPIKISVGKEVLGRMFNVVGETIDEKGPIETEMKASIHRPAPKFEDQDTGRRLAFLRSINDEIIDKRELACELIDFMKDEGNGYAGLINSKYGVSEDNVDHQVISDIAMVRKCLIKGGEPDIDRASGMFIDDFRSGKLGRITLEKP